MASHRITLFDPMDRAAAKKTAAPVRLPAAGQNDVFLNALLEMPTTKRARRSPLEWAGAMLLHVGIIALLIIVPLYTTGTISLNGYEDVPLVAPPPPAPPAPPPAGPVAVHVTHTRPKLTYKIQKITQPTAIPRRVRAENVGAAEPPEVAGVAGGVPGGVVGGQIGGTFGGALGGTGTVAPPPPPVQPRATPKIVRVGSNLKAPRQTFSVDPEYPPLARQTHVSGTVVLDAIIDERGNVVQAHVVSGNPLLISAALRAVLQWKYQPTSLNGQPISVELQVQVHFDLHSQ